MRPSSGFFLVLIFCLAAQLLLVQAARQQLLSRSGPERLMRDVVAYLGLSDLCLATDARYIRNLAVTDPLAPFMDHPGTIEHFPGGSFWIPEP